VYNSIETKLNAHERYVMTRNKDKCVKKCDAELKCKSTSALEKSIANDLTKPDGNLEELLNEKDSNQVAGTDTSETDS